MLLLNIACTLGLIVVVACFDLPPLSGRYEVGTVAFEIIDPSRVDPLAPDTRVRDLMLSAYYPTTTPKNHGLANAYTAPHAAFLERKYGLPSGAAANVVSQAHTSAPIARSNNDMPLILFSPGYGLSRSMYTSILSSIASSSYIVLALDHPFDTDFIDYPDGRSVSNTQAKSVNWKSPEYVSLRADDVRFVLDQILGNASVAAQIPGVGDRVLKPAKVALFGHSAGGATAAWTMHLDARIGCGVDLDGVLVGPVVDAGLDRPFAILGAEDRKANVEPSWASLRAASTAWKGEVSVTGSLHYGFSDLGFEAQAWRDQGGGEVSAELGKLVDSVGPIAGGRMLRVMDAWMVDFWKGCLGGEGYGLWEKGASKEWPEVVVRED
ncbi:hypothetical protein EJ05DRAFT_5660 [Pseudovirgaria hyperparasitica]|uniref:1-alkyl-2-acetylglycerophosphocholine esterase n=1 Tax=Pseudovirgaria hyperparasitica TaxID=470096 RepID=A0A6A6WJE9_9PEZI|nr:uncharacterized protein EJ05DRAFT_5660 [Pseudovirgaria hyperparasitica]KAF2762549.1 hypothetical protein EJ05DRAFT_5660 [Pseudovirgaria hyperparasitica]